MIVTTSKVTPFFCSILVVLVVYLVVPRPTLANGGTIITVNSLADDLTDNGNCTLREAVAAANNNTPVDNCPAGTGITQPDTIAFSTNGLFALNHPDGDLYIESPLILEGNGQNQTILDGLASHRLLEIDDAGTVTLRHLTLQNGYQEHIVTLPGVGGAIRSYRTDLTLENVTVQNSRVEGYFGGGISSYGNTLTLVNSTIRNNSADDTEIGGGGIIAVNAVMTVIDSTISYNSANNTNTEGGGGGIIAGGTELTLINSTVNHNSANNAEYGGGGILANSSLLTIENSVVSDNSADQSFGGGITIFYENGGIYSSVFTMTHSLLSNNRADNGQGGGGLYAVDSEVMIEQSTIQHNRANGSMRGGGGIFIEDDIWGGLFIYF